MSRTNKALWEKTVAQVKAGTKGGDAGEWSARKAQLAGKIYKEKGGSYSGEKTESQKSLTKWTKEEWGTKSGKPSTQGPKATGERYLPKKAREALSKEEYARTSAKKREDTKKGKQFSKQPESVAKKTARFRK
jgi:hypothetical protein